MCSCIPYVAFIWGRPLKTPEPATLRCSVSRISHWSQAILSLCRMFSLITLLVRMSPFIWWRIHFSSLQWLCCIHFVLPDGALTHICQAHAYSSMSIKSEGALNHLPSVFDVASMLTLLGHLHPYQFYQVWWLCYVASVPSDGALTRTSLMSSICS